MIRVAVAARPNLLTMADDALSRLLNAHGLGSYVSVLEKEEIDINLFCGEAPKHPHARQLLLFSHLTPLF